MPSWGELLNELQVLNFDQLRHKYLAQLSQKTGRNVISYYSGWLEKRTFDVEINDKDMTGFMNALKGLDCSKGLDLILHTPGGDPTATEGIVKFLQAKFNNDIRVIVPQLAMSAGTMLACSAKEIIMGKHSYLGPIDPQYNGIPAYNIILEYQEAKNELSKNPKNKEYWKIQLDKYKPAFYYTLIDAVHLSSELTKEWLKNNMFKDTKNANEIIKNIVSYLNKNNKSHSRHFSYSDCKQLGLNVTALEEDQELQELVLSVHHASTITLNRTNVSKMIENHLGSCYIIQQKT